MVARFKGWHRLTDFRGSPHSSRNLHTSSPLLSPARPLGDSPRSRRITAEMKTLGLQSGSGANGDSPLFGEAGPLSSDDEDDDVILIAGAGDSSEEEALAQVVKRRTRRPRSRSPVASSADKSVSVSEPNAAVAVTVAAPPAAATPFDPPGMPDYESLAITTLQRKVRQYGFRASKEKDVLVAQLRQVWIAMHPDLGAGAGTPPVLLAEPIDGGGGGGGDKSKKGTRRRTPLVTAAGDEATSAPAEAKTRRSRTETASKAVGVEAAAVDAENATAVPGATIGEKLRHLIINHETLYLRILRYEVRRHSW